MFICYGQDSGGTQVTLNHTKTWIAGCHFACALSLVVIMEHDYIIDSTYFWTDSSIEFQWIHEVCKRHPAFIANRIGEILDSTEPWQWNHCPGLLNSGDDGNRGLLVTTITSGSRCLLAPAWKEMAEEKFNAWTFQVLHWWPTGPRNNCDLDWCSERSKGQVLFSS